MSSGELTLLKTVKANSTIAAAPSISPDGEKILIALDNAIHIMNSDGTNLTTLSVLKGFRPEWDANGSGIYFSSLGVAGLSPGIYKTDKTAAVPVMISKNPSVGIYGGFALNH